jgi:prepilin-type processing-associated H-X9-DG protein
LPPGPPQLDYVPTYGVRSNVPAAVALACGVLLFVPFLSGIAALVLGRLGLRRADEVHGRGRRMSQAAIVLGVVNLVLSVALVGASFPATARARQRAQQIKCASNLRQISMAIIMYTNANRGFVPPDLDALMPFFGTPQGAAAVCTCPDAAAHGVPPATAGKAMNYSYVYVQPTVPRINQIRGPSTTVAAYEPLANHGGRSVNVVFWDGHVELLEGAAAQTMVAQLLALQAASAGRRAAASQLGASTTSPSPPPSNLPTHGDTP